MSPQEQELMERYLYQVVRRLPKEQREEVRMELAALIEDMWEDAGSMDDVLTKLGDPAEFAKKYPDTGRHLIGPDYYDTYIWFLKIVLLCTAIPVTVVAAIEGVREGAGLADSHMVQAAVTSAIHGITNGILNLVISLVGAFGGVTLTFAVMERQKVKLDLKEQKNWSVDDLNGGWTPSRLTPVPHKKAIISRGDSLVGIVFIVLFGVLLTFAPQFFSAIYQNEGEMVIVPIFNLDEWPMILPVFLLSLLVGLADEVFRLVVGHYSKPVMISNIVCGGVQMVLSWIVLKVFPFWNPHFAADLQAQIGDQAEGASWFIQHWDANAASHILLIVIFLITIAEIATTIYKTQRYGITAVQA